MCSLFTTLSFLPITHEICSLFTTVIFLPIVTETCSLFIKAIFLLITTEMCSLFAKVIFLHITIRMCSLTPRWFFSNDHKNCVTFSSRRFFYMCSFFWFFYQSPTNCVPFNIMTVIFLPITTHISWTVSTFVCWLVRKSLLGKRNTSRSWLVENHRCERERIPVVMSRKIEWRALQWVFYQLYHGNVFILVEIGGKSAAVKREQFPVVTGRGTLCCK